jgi:hypothetical protein
MNKAILICFLTFMSIGCSNDDNFIESEELTNITTVEGPTQITLGERVAFVVTFRVPSTCHSFQRLNFGIDGNTRTISVVMAITDRACNPLSNFTEEVTFDVEPDTTGVFTFLFFSGNDSNGQATFITRELEVLPAAG